MTETIKIRRFRGGSLFKLLLIGHLFFFVPFFCCVGILGYFGLVDVSWNKVQVEGLKAFFTAVFMGAFTTLMSTVFLWIVLFSGLWIYSRFRSLELECIPSVQQAQTEDK